MTPRGSVVHILDLWASGGMTLLRAGVPLRCTSKSLVLGWTPGSDVGHSWWSVHSLLQRSTKVGCRKPSGGRKPRNVDFTVCTVSPMFVKTTQDRFRD